MVAALATPRRFAKTRLVFKPPPVFPRAPWFKPLTSAEVTQDHRERQGVFKQKRHLHHGDASYAFASL
jgi:hypothetical protein